MQVSLRSWIALWVLFSLFIVLGGAMSPARAQITSPESLSEIRRVLKELRAYKNSNARLEAIKRFDDLILTSDATMRAIEQCNESEFKRLRRRIVDVVDSTTAARQRIAKLERQRRKDVKRLDSNKKEWRTRWRVAGRQLSNRTAFKAMAQVFDDTWDAAAKGPPEPLGVVLRAAFGALKSSEKWVSKDFEIFATLDRAIFYIEKLESWEEEITNPEIVAGIPMLHELARARIRTAKRVLKWMDKSFAKHACMRCVGKKKEVVAAAVKNERTGVWKAAKISPQQCIAYKPGKVIMTYPDGRKVTVSFDKKTGEIEVLDLLPKNR
jgi:hypothetical protein